MIPKQAECLYSGALVTAAQHHDLYRAPHLLPFLPCQFTWSLIFIGTFVSLHSRNNDNVADGATYLR
jgi:hypothetical protein